MDIEALDPYVDAAASDVRGLSYTFHAPEEIRALSVLRLMNPSSFDELGRPMHHGLYDPRLGPVGYDGGQCKTCGLTYKLCPGHFGHIELPVPLLQPMLFDTLCTMLRKMCWNCHRFRDSQRVAKLTLAKLRLLSSNNNEGAEWMEKWMDVTQSGKTLEGVEILDLRQKSIRSVLENAPRDLGRAIARIDSKEDVDNDFESESFKPVDDALVDCVESQWRAFLKKGISSFRPAPWYSTITEFLKTGSGKCGFCAEESMRLRKDTREKRVYSKSDGLEKPVSSLEIEGHLRQLWNKERDMCEMIWGCFRRSKRHHSLDYRIFLIKTMLVPPPKFRKWSKTGGSEHVAEHPQNIFYSRVLKRTDQLLKLFAEARKEPQHGQQSGELSEDEPGGNADNDSDSSPGKESLKAISKKQTRLIVEMQRAMNELQDSVSPEGEGTGIRQQLDTKVGLLREHMMGKRVNYSCRSVIGPDVFLETDEVGITESFAKQITFPEYVTALNSNPMRKAILNGPDYHPGALGVEEPQPNGLSMPRIRFRSSKLKGLLRSQASLLLNPSFPKRVLRHAKAGDRVLFNRQPSLHRSSLLGHRLRVFSGDDKTIRFHYANCNGYNADYDGDEMNIHFPQDLLAQAEVEHLALADSHYISATSGEPIRGLIQDHVLSGVLLTYRDTFLTRDTFVQLLYSCVDYFFIRYKPGGSNRIKMPRPAILAPQELFTGKQVISALLRTILHDQVPLNVVFSSGTRASVIVSDETTVRIRQGDLLQGVLDKSAFGDKSFGLVHAVNEVYGSKISGILLSALGRLFTLFLRVHGHTTGVDDLLLKKSAEEVRISTLQSARREAAWNVLSTVAPSLTKAGVKAKRGTAKSKRGSNDDGQISDIIDDKVNMQRIVTKLVREKGRAAEDMLDKAMLNEMNKIGNKINLACFPAAGLLKQFPSNGFSLMASTGAKGSAKNTSQICALHGQTILQGRRAPRMGGSGRTLAAFEPFDLMPSAGGFIGSRYLTGLAPHEYFFHSMAGREGLIDTAVKTKDSGYLQRCLVKHLEGFRLHYDSTVRDSNNRLLQFTYGEDGLDVTKAPWIMEKPEFGILNKEAIRSSWKERGGENANATSLFVKSVPTSMIASRSTSQRYQGAIQSLTTDNDERKFLVRRYERAIANPGDAVGMLAAFALGEPSTQMTLNTFHFAGAGVAHVIGGIPRLIEIIQSAKRRPATPSMTLPLKKEVTESKASSFATAMMPIKLLDLLETFQIGGDGLEIDHDVCAYQRFSLVLRFPEESIYCKDTGFGFDRLKRATATVFAHRLNAAFGAAVNALSETDETVKRFTKLTVVAGISKIRPRKEIELAEEQLASRLAPWESFGPDPDLAVSNGIDGDDNSRGEEEENEANFSDESEAEAVEEPKESYKHGSRNVSVLEAAKTTVTGERNIELTLEIPVDLCTRLELANLVKKTAKETLLSAVQGIDKCFLSRGSDQKSNILGTEGSNLRAIWEMNDLIKINNISTNDLWEIAGVYGVEALRAALFRELTQIFKAQDVDPRHLTVISDYMTQDGGFTPLGRMSHIEAPSPFQLMSFGMTTKSIVKATFRDMRDDLASPSAAVALGRIYSGGGTGGFDLLQTV